MKKVSRSFLAVALLAAIVVPALSLGLPDYPAPVTKKLYAKNDLRGKAAPKLEVSQWLTGAAPQTKGKVVLVDFWATWCGPCRKVIPELNEWQKKFSKDLVVVGISDEPAETVQKFMQQTKMEYPVAIDPEKRMSKFVGVEGIPHVLVISPDGVVRWQGFPGSQEEPLTEKLLKQIIDASKASR